MAEARVIEVIETTDIRGCGRAPNVCRAPGCPHEPVHRVTQYFTRDGALLAERDHWKEEQGIRV